MSKTTCYRRNERRRRFGGRGRPLGGGGLRRRRRHDEDVYAHARTARQELLRQSTISTMPGARAAALGIPHYVLNFEANVSPQRDRPVRRRLRARPHAQSLRLVQQLRQARDAREYADRLGAQFIATGHYARLERRADGAHLYRTSNAKDQSYALAQLTREQLDRLLLPVGTMEKSETREHARAHGAARARKDRVARHLLRRRRRLSRRAASAMQPRDHARRRRSSTRDGRPVGDARRRRAIHDRTARETSRRATTARAT